MNLVCSECNLHWLPTASDHNCPVCRLKKQQRKLCQALDGLMLYAVLHEQQHPEWNGNRFDDVQLARSALEEAGWKRA